MNIPAQYLPVMPYLVIDEAEKLIEFSKTIFGATEQLIARDNDGKIMHAEIRIHDAVIMIGQSGGEWKQKPAGMFLHVEDVDGIYAKAIANGATSLGAPETKEYGYTAGFEDPFGNHWFIVKA